MMGLLKVLAAGALLMGAIASAHPGAHEDRGMSKEAKAQFHARARRSLDACSDHLERHGVLKRAAEKRFALYEKHKKPKTKRDNTWQSSHHSNLTGITATSPDSTFFASNATCILNPEGDNGPFWIDGEYVRQDITDNEPGVPVYLHAQFIDIANCNPIEGLYWDIWSANSTGVYR
jgi:hypothetical protein